MDTEHPLPPNKIQHFFIDSTGWNDFIRIVTVVINFSETYQNSCIFTFNSDFGEEIYLKFRRGKILNSPQRFKRYFIRSIYFKTTPFSCSSPAVWLPGRACFWRRSPFERPQYESRGAGCCRWLPWMLRDRRTARWSSWSLRRHHSPPWSVRTK